MKFHYDKKEDALSIRFEGGKYVESEEVREGILFDYDEKGKLIGIEILDASSKLSSPFKKLINKKKVQIALTPR